MVLSVWKQRLAPYWAAQHERPFGRLAIHFFHGFFTSDMAADSDNSLSVGAIFALLAVPGLLLPLFLLDKYSTLTLFLMHRPRFNVFVAAIPDRFFFVNFSIAVTGIATVLKWDSLFPDRRDFANLAVLPIPLNHILYAKAAALAFLMAMFAADINFASTVVFPFIVVVSTPEANTQLFLTMVASHAVSVVLASLFTFFCLLAVAGFLMSVLPSRWFQRVSRYVRVIAIAGLLVQFLTSVSIGSRLNGLQPGSRLEWLPAVWFTGLGQGWMARGGNPHLIAQGALAWRATGLAFAVAALCYLATYRRYFLRIPESLDVPAGLKRRSGARLAALAARAISRDSFERACVQFTLWTLVRSEKHALFLGAYLGLGLTLAGESPQDAAPILAFFLLTGLRVVFDLPSELGANWAFQLAAEPDGREAPGAAKKVMLLSTLSPLGLIVLPWSVWSLGWIRGPVYCAFLALVFLLFTNLLLTGYWKIPFTCARIPGKRNPAIGLAVFVASFLIFVPGAQHMAAWILAKPWRLAEVAVAGYLAWKIAKPYLEQFAGDRHAVMFEEEREPAVRSLRIA